MSQARLGQPLRIWCNARFPPLALTELRDGLGGHELQLAAGLQETNLTAGADPGLQEADIAFGQPDVMAALRQPRLRWIQLTTASYERFDKPDVRAALRARGAMLTTNSSVFAEPCAQHVLGMMLSLARRLPQCMENQLGQRAWPARQVRAESRLLTGQAALLLGYGAIGQRLAELLAPFRMRLAAVRRTPTGREPIAVHPLADLPRLLAEADHVVNLLPHNEQTVMFLDAQRIGMMKPSTVLYNIGRGTTVDQAALRAALEGGRLAAAYLDVMSPEPLPPDNPLWAAPRCYITPHSAGGHGDEQLRTVRHFLGNLRRLEAGEALVDRVV